MASQPSKTADELTTAIRSLVDKALESQTREQIAARGREVAAAIAGTAGTAAGRASDIANDVWRDSASQRREAAKTARRSSNSEGGSRDPYAAAHPRCTGVSCLCSNIGLWLWVPAFAATAG